MRIVCRVFAEGDQAGKRSDERSRAADVDTDEKCGYVGGKLREQDRGGDVADDLAGENAKEERILCEELGE